MKVHYLVYKLTNLVNGKIYIGCHMTKNLDDSYMGSGRRIGYAIKKYGIENFKKEILSTHDTPEQMLAEEARLVNEEFIERIDVYNLALGGKGSWFYVNSVLTEEQRTKAGIAGGFSNRDKLSEESIQKIQKGNSIGGSNGRIVWNERVNRGEIPHQSLGNHHSAEMKQKMSSSQSKSMMGNSRQVGCKMMYDPISGRQYRVKLDQVEQKLDSGLILGMSPLIKSKVSSSLKLEGSAKGELYAVEPKPARNSP